MSKILKGRALLAAAVGLASLATLAVVPASLAVAQPAAPVGHFMVLGPPGGLSLTTASIEAAGGTVLQRWDRIGVVVATSPVPSFAKAVRPMAGVEGAGASRALVEFLPPAQQVQTAIDRFGRVEPAGPVPAAAAGTAAEPLEANQWNLRQIKADVANAVSGGSRDVVVGVLDSGVDATHPDIAPNFDQRKSVSCANEGVPDTSPAAQVPNHPHGTHVAGIIAAARNGVGVAGVAPNVRIASVKVGDADGMFYPEYVVCGFVWAADHGIDITNSSWFADPWFKWCADDPDQRAGAEAMRRAINYAAKGGVVNIGSLGNDNWDLTYDVVDTHSPTNQTPITRTVGNACPMVPAEMNGIVGVSAVGPDKDKAFYSNYGIGDTRLTGPGGDRMEIPNTPDANGRVLSTVLHGGYGYLSGTSMAGPHVAGVAALMLSKHPTWSSGRIAQELQAQADRIPCPPNPYDPDGTGTYLATCEGGDTGQGFYGAGLVDALDAVTR